MAIFSRPPMAIFRTWQSTRSEFESLLVQYLNRERQSVRNAIAFERRMTRNLRMP